jgi:hypothetical protein
VIELFRGDQHDPADFVASAPSMGQVAQGAGLEDDALLGKQLDPCFGRFGAVQDGCKRGHCPAPFTELP